jgi:RHH-type rel operon transcriptional repressor/antitoxin RelB
MTTTLSVRINSKVRERLEALAASSKRSKSFLAAEAIAAYVEAEEWQLGEIQAGLKDLAESRTVSHERVSRWLRSWGQPGEASAPR